MPASPARFRTEAPLGTSAALIVTAHPDDEAMFFGPTIQVLGRQGFRVRLLCLSTGDAEGRGQVRVLELLMACQILKIDRKDIEVVNHPDLQDGHDKSWPVWVIEEVLSAKIAHYKALMVISFDPGGISGHANHCALAQGMRATAATFAGNRALQPAFFQLVSVGCIRKFMGPIEAILAAWWRQPRAHLRDTCLATSPLSIMHAMQQHRSQWLWFRIIFIVASRYSYINDLQLLES